MSDALLDDFELHLRLCPDCLTHGNNLCPEAQYIADDVRAAHQRPTFTARRRPIFRSVRLPGIVA
jgi:hypothetical protein